MAFRVRYTFQDESASHNFYLEYKIIDSEFHERWLMALSRDIKRHSGFQKEQFYGKGFVQESHLRDEINSILKKLNKREDLRFCFETYKDMTIVDLMQLHDHFERLEPLPWIHKSPDIYFALVRLNHLIHKYEMLYMPIECFHAEVRFNELISYKLLEADYDLFDLNEYDRSLALDYGVTGVPVLNAFLGDVAQKPVPQYNFKSSAKLCFRKTSAFSDDQKNNLSIWLKNKWKLDINDKKLALGQIYLGFLDSKLSNSEILENLKTHQTLSRVEILTSQKRAPVDLSFVAENMEEYVYA